MSTQTATILFLLSLAAAYSFDGPSFRESQTMDFAEDQFSPVYLPLLNADKDPAAGTFRIIGGAAAAKPCCVSWGPGRVDCFIRNDRARVGHWWKENGKYQQDWANLFGIVLGQVECVSRAPGVIDLMVLGTDLNLFVKAKASATAPFPRNWNRIPTRISEAPSCVARTATAIDCVVRSGTNAGNYIDQVNGKWTKYGTIKGVCNDPAKISFRSATQTDYWCVGGNSNLFVRYRNAGRFSGWANRGGKVKGQPEVISVNPKRIDILMPSVSTELTHLAWNGNWQSWVNLGGSIVDSPSCVAIDGILHCFMVQLDSYLYRRSYDGKGWSDWFCAYGSFVEGPKCVVSNLAEKEVSCYARGFNRKIVEMIYKF